MRRSLRFLLALAALFGTAELAHAHPLVDQAAEAHGQAEFERALELLDRAESSEDLTREDVVALLYQRALSSYALGRLEEMELSLQRLVTLEPRHPLSPTMPPEIRAALEGLEADAEAPLSIEARVEREEGRAQVEASVFGDEGGLVRGVRLAARPEGGRWRVVDETSLRLDAGHGPLVVEYWAEAIGPGRAVLASAGSAAAPLRDEPAPSRDETTPAAPAAPAGAGGSSAWPWITVGGAAAVAIGALVLLLVTADASEEGTQLTSPMLELQWSR